MENAFGRLMVALRKAEGLTVTAAAAKLGMTKSYLSVMEKGKSNPPSPKVLQSIQAVYGQRVSFENLLELAWIEKAPEVIRKRLREKCRNPLYEVTLTAPQIRIPRRG